MIDETSKTWESHSPYRNMRVERDSKAFNSLLDLAENVHAHRESLRKQFFLAAAAGAGGILASAAAIASSSLFISSGEYLSFNEVLRSPLNLVFLSVGIVSYVVVTFGYIQYKRQMRRENRALHEVMSIIHEVLQSSEVNMSPLEIAEIKIRLSRMDN